MEKLYKIPKGKIAQLPEISTDFYAKLQDLLFLVTAPEILVELKSQGDKEYYETISPIFEFLGAVEEKFIIDGVAELDKGDN